MRLLIVSQYFWPETFRINDLARELIARGHEVTILTGLPNYPDGKIFSQYRKNPLDHGNFEGAPVLRVPVVPRGANSLQLAINYLSFAVSGCLFGRSKLRGRTFDAIFVFQTSPITSALPALWIGRKRRIPVLMWVLDLWPETLSAVGVVKSPRWLRLVERLVRFIYRRCELILVQSRAFVESVDRYAGGRKKIRYFPGWAENVFEDATYAGKVPELAPYADKFKILFAGNIGHAQDFPAIVAAADLLRDVADLVWIVAGDGRAASEAKSEVARLGLENKVIFLGRFPLERMPSFFDEADALLVSLRDEPVWGMTIPGKVQSYLASSKPLLGMLNGEGARVIDDAGAGLVGPAGNAEALAANVSKLITMAPDTRLAMGKAGRDYCAREFNRELLVDRLEKWIVDLQNA
jgi:colanic acid biosynthesis glycosyl transferase WcaI